jgi:hypothetical protein
VRSGKRNPPPRTGGGAVPRSPLPPAPPSAAPPGVAGCGAPRRSTRLCGVSVSVMLVRSGVDNPFRDARTTLEPRLSTSITDYGAYALYSTRLPFVIRNTHAVADRAPHRAAAPTTHRDPRIVSLSALGAPPQAQHGPWMPVATMVAASLLSLKSRPQPVSHEHMHIHTYGVSTQRAPHHSHPSHSLKRDVLQHDFGDRAPTPQGSFHTQPHHASSRYNTTEFRRAGGSCRPPFTHTRSHWLSRSSQRRWRAREVANKARDAVSGAHRRDASILDQPAHRYAL